jgi:hypothetical protein
MGPGLCNGKLYLLRLFETKGAMKVLDLQCAHGHVFEGWFASEAEFASQCSRALVLCPMCGDPSIVKKLSAPRLNLGGSRQASGSSLDMVTDNAAGTSLSAAWMAIARHVIANTTDVGQQFAEEARRMHYGETEERSIRGRTTLEEAHALIEEGISVMPLPLPEAAKETLQ